MNTSQQRALWAASSLAAPYNTADHLADLLNVTAKRAKELLRELAKMDLVEDLSMRECADSADNEPVWSRFRAMPENDPRTIAEIAEPYPVVPWQELKSAMRQLSRMEAAYIDTCAVLDGLAAAVSRALRPDGPRLDQQGILSAIKVDREVRVALLTEGEKNREELAQLREAATRSPSAFASALMGEVFDLHTSLSTVEGLPVDVVRSAGAALGLAGEVAKSLEAND